MNRPQIIIGIVGRAGSGKSTLARLLEERHGFSEESFAAPVKSILRDLFGWSDEILYGPSHLREVPDPAWGGLTPRRALQVIGSDIARQLHPDVWVRALLNDLTAPSAPRRVVVSDVRFQNELDALKRAGAEIVKLSRPGVPEGQHASEQVDALTGIDFWIANDGTLEALQASADALVESVLDLAGGVGGAQ